MFCLHLVAVLRLAAIGSVLLLATHASLAQHGPTSAPTTGPTATSTQKNAISVDQITRELHPPALEQILLWLEPIPDVSGILSQIPEGPTADGGGKPPASQASADQMGHILRLEAELAGRRQRAQYEEASRVAQQLSELCSQAYGARHWKTRDAQSLSESFEYLATLPESAQDGFTWAQKLQPTIQELYAQNRFDEAQQLVLERLAFLREVRLWDHPAAAEDWLTLGALLRTTGSYQYADLCYREGIRIYRDHLSLHHPDVATGLRGLAWLRYEQDEQRTAKTLLCAALAMRREVLGDVDEAVMTSLGDLATVEQREGGYAAAERLLGYAQRVQISLPDCSPIRQANTICSLADLQKAKGDYPGAERLYLSTPF